MPAFSSVLIGNDSLTHLCGAQLLAAGHPVRAVVTRDAGVADWARGAGLMCVAPGPGLADRLAGLRFDWLLSIANLDILPDAVLDLALRGAVNFHDGPLPRLAGLNAPVWAILQGETAHGITWHMIQRGVDQGDILVQRAVPVAADDTALSLNMKCLTAGIDSFAEVIAALATGAPATTPQDLSQRSYFGRAARPTGWGRIDFAQSAEAGARLVRALDHGPYRNPMCRAWVALADRVIHVDRAEVTSGTGRPGTVLGVTADSLTVACAQGALHLTGLSQAMADLPDLAGLVAPGDLLPPTDPAEAEAVSAARTPLIGAEAQWAGRLADLRLPDPALTPGAPGDPVVLPLPGGIDTAHLQAAFGALMARLSGGDVVDLALAMEGLPGHVAPWVPLRLEPGGTLAEAAATLQAAVPDARMHGPFAADLPLRLPGLSGLRMPCAALSEDRCLPGAALTLVTGAQPALIADPGQVSSEHAALIAARIVHMAQAAPETPLSALPILPQAERDLLTHGWNATRAEFDAEHGLQQIIAAQSARTPDAPAVIFEDRVLSHRDLDARANCIAQVLRSLGVARGSLVGLHLRRGPDLVAGALAIWKAGGAYVPLDPAYPADRVALYLDDSGAEVILTEAAIAADLPAHGASVLTLEDPRIDAAAATAPGDGAGPHDLAYLIYTSGSTGRPKGVMIEHAHVANFLAGMDDRIPHDPPGTWLAVTSLSFDISVLELFWTLARGFAVVIAGDAARVDVGGRALGTGRGMDMSLYYWGNDDGAGRDKYRLLLEGARFADAHGFCAVWTPERHFHAFGGPYPNPSVTGAAVAAVTRNIGVRAGSCVAPLHHPARIAEEWAVIDNLTNGRAGLAIASGWQPDDFVLRPENAPPQNKPAMYRAIADLRALWRGEAVEFPVAGGGTHALVTQPRPVSKEVPIWVTTAGNPDTWREAGALGANVLTHLLGQSVAEVGEKIAIYHAALRKAGHDPADHKVTLMLHTFLAETRDAAREIARGPMKEYLRSAAGLIKQYAWAFPAFKKPAGVDTPMQLDLGSLEPEELDGILDFAFLRYFDDSGLFGTIEDALGRIETLKAIGVDEIACLIDYGIDVDRVLEGLYPLAQVLRRTNEDAGQGEDYSIAAQIRRHGVTHLQCTPSMARMLVTNDEARAALAQVSHLMIGGEALPDALLRDLAAATDATVENMYGPTETTIWSTTGPARPGTGVASIARPGTGVASIARPGTGVASIARPGTGVASIGRPIANTVVHVLDDDLAPLPVGVAGELWIGGAGVARGYWQRPDLTAERFRPDPFRADTDPGARMYRTGDLARWRADGTLDFLGRADQQIKLRGYRIEPGEIEAVIEAGADVTQAVVMAREDAPGVVRLVGYYTGTADEAALRDRIAAVLPVHMVPGRLLRIAEFPLTPNRKVDRKALPAPEAVSAPAAAAEPGAAEPPPQPVDQRAVAPIAPPLSAGSPAAPAAPPEVMAAIAAIWQRILGVQAVRPRDSFFDLGGHSLLAVQAHRDIRAELGLRALSITDIFRFPVLADLAARVVALAGPVAPVAPVTASAPPAPAPPPAPTTDAPRDPVVVSPAIPANSAPAPVPKPSQRNAAMAERRALRAARLSGR